MEMDVRQTRSITSKGEMIYGLAYVLGSYRHDLSLDRWGNDSD